jgi:hypothetical protein
MEDALKANIITELGLDKLSAKDREAALLKIGEIIFKTVLIRIIDTLDEEGRKDLDAHLSDPVKAKDPDALYAFLRAKVPNLDELVGEEIAAFKRDALETMRGLD